MVHGWKRNHIMMTGCSNDAKTFPSEHKLKKWFQPIPTNRNGYLKICLRTLRGSRTRRRAWARCDVKANYHRSSVDTTRSTYLLNWYHSLYLGTSETPKNTERLLYWKSSSTTCRLYGFIQPKIRTNPSSQPLVLACRTDLCYIKI